MSLSAKRLNIIEAKRKLYSEILRLEVGEWTSDDQRIGRVLILDSEIQPIFDRAAGKAGKA